jgi:hypothetical protein
MAACRSLVRLNDLIRVRVSSDPMTGKTILAQKKIAIRIAPHFEYKLGCVFRWKRPFPGTAQPVQFSGRPELVRRVQIIDFERRIRFRFYPNMDRFAKFKVGIYEPREKCKVVAVCPHAGGRIEDASKLRVVGHN